MPSSSCRAAAAAAAGRSVVDMPTAMRCTCHHHDRRKMFCTALPGRSAVQLPILNLIFGLRLA